MFQFLSFKFALFPKIEKFQRQNVSFFKNVGDVCANICTAYETTFILRFSVMHRSYLTISSGIVKLSW
jgi:hypothetical protein